MTRPRWILFGFTLLAFAVLAYVLREAIYELIVVPLAYTLWLLELLYLAVPQLVKWVLLIVLMSVGILWKLIPDLPSGSRSRTPSPAPEGRVASLAIGLQRALTSNYFKWQVANRLGRLARRISEPSKAPLEFERGLDAISRYLSAGLNQSFVDFPGPRSRFARRLPTPLDVDPEQVVSHLEARMDLRHDGRTRRR